MPGAPDKDPAAQLTEKKSKDLRTNSKSTAKKIHLAYLYLAGLVWSG